MSNALVEKIPLIDLPIDEEALGPFLEDAQRMTGGRVGIDLHAVVMTRASGEGGIKRAIEEAGGTRDIKKIATLSRAISALGAGNAYGVNPIFRMWQADDFRKILEHIASWSDENNGAWSVDFDVLATYYRADNIKPKIWGVVQKKRWGAWAKAAGKLEDNDIIRLGGLGFSPTVETVVAQMDLSNIDLIKRLVGGRRPCDENAVKIFLNRRDLTDVVRQNLAKWEIERVAENGGWSSQVENYWILRRVCADKRWRGGGILESILDFLNRDNKNAADWELVASILGRWKGSEKEIWEVARTMGKNKNGIKQLDTEGVLTREDLPADIAIEWLLKEKTGWVADRIAKNHFLARRAEVRKILLTQRQDGRIDFHLLMTASDLGEANMLLEELLKYDPEAAVSYLSSPRRMAGLEVGKDELNKLMRSPRRSTREQVLKTLGKIKIKASKNGPGGQIR